MNQPFLGGSEVRFESYSIIAKLLSHHMTNDHMTNDHMTNDHMTNW